MEESRRIEIGGWGLKIDEILNGVPQCCFSDPPLQTCVLFAARRVVHPFGKSSSRNVSLDGWLSLCRANVRFSRSCCCRCAETENNIMCTWT